MVRHAVSPVGETDHHGICIHCGCALLPEKNTNAGTVYIIIHACIYNKPYRPEQDETRNRMHISR